jgi:hypothetical protein
MSMSSHFVEISPAILKRLLQEPSLVATIVYPTLADRACLSDSDADSMIRSWTPAQQQYFRAVQSADADAIVAALKKLVPRKQWQLMQAHISSRTKEQLLKEAAESRERLTESARGFQSMSRPVARENSDGPPIRDQDLGERMCIDKAWGGLHYLLCGAMNTGREALGCAVLGGTEIGDDHGYGPARYLSAPRVETVAAALSALTHEALRQRYNAAAMNEARVYPGHWDDEHDSDFPDRLLKAFDELHHFYRRTADHGNAVIKYLR